MADPKHLRILKQGVKAFNEWREENPDIKPNLIQANLIKADLSQADLFKADLSEAKFREAKVSKGDLSEANIKGADFSGADLKATDLSGGDFTGADLSEADLSGAKLSEAILVKANLSGANLCGVDAYKADFFKADLSKAKLIKADFSGANLWSANLWSANLKNAILKETTLVRANLIEADLIATDLSRADLSGANLSGANVNKANLSRAKFGNTTIGDIDLSNVSGLESTMHWRPSTIGIDTVFLSDGKISHKFLENSGVPAVFIDYMESLTRHAFKFYSCFISYSNNDKEFADRLYADLRKENVRCWFAPEDMKIGDKIRQIIDQSIHIYDKLLLVLSENSINSKWVEKEVETAFEKESRKKIVLFPVRLDDSVMETDESWAADIRRTRYIGDFTTWKNHDSYQEAFKRLLRDLQAEDH